MTNADALRLLLRHARDTVSDPRDGARVVLAQGLSREALWTAFALVTVLRMSLDTVSAALFDVDPTGLLTLGLLQAGLTVIAVVAIQAVGARFGGEGDFDGALALVTWLMFIELLFQAAQVVFLILLMPAIAFLIWLAGIGVMLWLLTHFVAMLHGFSSLGRVFLGILGTGLAISLLANLLLSVLGIDMTGLLFGDAI